MPAVQRLPWVVVGGGPAAVAAALRLAEDPRPAEVLLIAASPAPGRDRSLWPALLSGSLSPAALSGLSARHLAGSRVRWLRATAERPPEGDAGPLHVRTRHDESELAREHLLWLAGPPPPDLEVPGRDLPGVFVLHSTGDCLTLTAYLDTEKPRRGVVVGASGWALGVATALAARRLHLTVFDGGEALLPDFDPAISRAIAPELRRAGIPSYTAAPLTGLEAGMRGHRRGRLRRVGSLRTSAVADFVVVVPPPSAPEASILWQERAGLARAETALGISTTVPPDTGVVVYRAFGLEVARTAPPAVPPGDLVCTSTDLFTRPEFSPPAPSEDPAASNSASGAALRLRFVLWSERESGRLVAAQVAGRRGAAGRARILAAAIQGGARLPDLPALDLQLLPSAGRARWDLSGEASGG